MLDTFKKYDSVFANEILLLDYNHKRILCLAIIARQRILVSLFDQKYHERCLSFFEESLRMGYEIILSNEMIALKIEDWINNLEKNIPDTDDYGEIEGSFAQNALISIVYFFHFCISEKDNEFSYSIEKVLESIDLINYEINESYEESIVISEEIHICKVIFQMLLNKVVDEQLVASVQVLSNKFLIQPRYL